ncbi:MAG TPA: universal stress protein [Pseudonocardiaceae bacterium]|nr:universal stress protein [Pseudonocardiaceae bacterium]
MSEMVAGVPIVAGVDGSDSALEAARWAADEAVRKRVPLRLVAVVQVPVASGYVGDVGLGGDLIDALRAESQHLLDEARSSLVARQPDLDVTTALLFGPPIPALVEESAGARLMVVGSRGLGGFRGMLVGSTAVALAARGRCPVAVIRGGGRPNGPVVVGVDGSPASEAAVELAFEEASLRRAELVAVHTWLEHASDAAYVATVQPVLDWDTLSERGMESLAERLAGWAEKYPDVVVVRRVTRGRPIVNLLAEAADAQLLLVGSRGRGAFAGVILGSTSQALVYHAPCPLIVARG